MKMQEKADRPTDQLTYLHDVVVVRSRRVVAQQPLHGRLRRRRHGGAEVVGAGAGAFLLGDGEGLTDVPRRSVLAERHLRRVTRLQVRHCVDSIRFDSIRFSSMDGFERLIEVRMNTCLIEEEIE